MTKRTIFFISDRTAITAETLGLSLLTQFAHMQFEQITLPFVDTIERAKTAVTKINGTAREKGARPIVFSTLINTDIRRIIRKSNCLFFDFFETFITPLEKELSMMSSHEVGRYHGMVNDASYKTRIDAVNYALGNDDGISTKEYDRADVILIGVSRTGKTPTCLYLGLQYGICAANYPLTEENLLDKYLKLPSALVHFHDRLYGLSINPERLHKIRSERRPDSRYASLKQCQLELFRAESLFYSENIPFLNTTTISIEEIAATIVHEKKLQRRVY
ncbi:MAG: pyruvate, water dikinase regulatory protein [Syntrophales bacterium]